LTKCRSFGRNPSGVPPSNRIHGKLGCAKEIRKTAIWLSPGETFHIFPSDASLSRHILMTSGTRAASRVSLLVMGLTSPPPCSVAEGDFEASRVCSHCSQEAGSHYSQADGLDYSQEAGSHYSQAEGLDYSRAAGSHYSQADGLDYSRAAGSHYSQADGLDYSRVVGSHYSQADGLDSLPAVDTPVGWLVHKGDGFQAGRLHYKEDDSSADGSPNCRRSPAGWCRAPVAGDTRPAAGGKGFAIRPRPCDCNKRCGIPNSNPIHPIPTAGWKPSARRW
jgi:hypothetical protein